MMAAGFPFGLIATHLHIGASLAYNLQKLSMFKFIQNDPVLKNQSIMVGASVGLCALFQAPIASLLIGVELTERVYSVNSFFLVFLSSYVTCWTVKLLNDYHGLYDYTIISNEQHGELDHDYLFYIMLGLLCGVISVLFIKANHQMHWYKR